VKYGFKVSNEETSDVLALGYLVIVAADRQTRKVTPIPSEIVEKLKPFYK
jgi:acyl-CoA thioesterase FadM